MADKRRPPSLSPAPPSVETHLPYTLQCQQVLTLHGLSGSSHTQRARPPPRFTDKLFAPQPHLDSADTMCAAMDDCRPPFLSPTATKRRRPFARPSVTAKKSGLAESPPNSALQVLCAGSVGPQVEAQNAASPRLSELVGRLDDAEHQIAQHGTCQMHPTSTKTSAAARLESQQDCSPTAVARTKSSTEPRGSRHPPQPPVVSTQARARAWMRQQDASCPPTAPSRPTSSSLARHGRCSATPMSRLLRNKFEVPAESALPYFTPRPRAASADVPRSSASRHPPLGARSPTPVFLTQGSAGAAQRSKSKVPTAQTEPLRVAVADERGSSAWLEGVLCQPIYSYKLMQSIEAPRSPPPRAVAGCVEPADVARQRLQYAQEKFEHERIAKQNELELFLDYRDRCRSVVAYKTVESHGAATPDTSTEAAAAVRELLLPLFEKQQAARAGCQRAKNTNAEGTGKKGLRSIWTQRVTEMAMEEDRRRLCDALRTFQVDFPAAALSIEAMEELRSAVIQHILRSSKASCSVLLTAKELTQLVVNHKKLTATHFRRTENLTVDDLADAMPSQAEAAFVRHAFRALATI